MLNANMNNCMLSSGYETLAMDENDLEIIADLSPEQQFQFLLEKAKKYGIK